MNNSLLKIGSVIEVLFPRRVPKGHEQEGQRPSIVVGLPHNTGLPRYPVLLAVPLTTKINDKWAKDNDLYLKINKGEGNLKEDSIALLDQVMSVDMDRIIGYKGNISLKKVEKIKLLLKNIFEITD